jgi:hypothetical protein
MASSYECAYCGASNADTDDHIPAKGLFAKGSGARLITVKSCDACNHGASGDDEYFRDTVLKHHRVADLPQAQPQVAAMLRAAGMPKKARYAAATVRSFVDLDVHTPAGLYLGKRPGFRVNGVRLAKAAERYIRGLHRHELGRRVPEGAQVAVAVNPGAVFAEQADVLQVFGSGTTRVVKQGVFWYSFVQPTDNPEASGWLLVFFDEFGVLGSVRPRTPGTGAPAA